jgi:hypothetical protein
MFVQFELSLVSHLMNWAKLTAEFYDGFTMGIVAGREVVQGGEHCARAHSDDRPERRGATRRFHRLRVVVQGHGGGRGGLPLPARHQERQAAKSRGARRAVHEAPGVQRVHALATRPHADRTRAGRRTEGVRVASSAQQESAQEVAA